MNQINHPSLPSDRSGVQIFTRNCAPRRLHLSGAIAIGLLLAPTLHAQQADNGGHVPNALLLPQALETADVALYFQAGGSSESSAGAYVEGENTLAAGEASSAIGAGASALGAGAVAYADAATALGTDSFAQGASSTAVGGRLALDFTPGNDFGAVINQQTTAIGMASTANGAGAQAKGDFNTAIGAGTLTEGKSAVALGGIVDVQEDELGSDFAGSVLQNTQASGRLSTAIGGGAQATEYAATSLGALAQASGIRSIAIGYVARATGYDATSIGDRAEARADWATAVGSGARALASNSVALGSNANAWAAGSTAVGAGAMANNENSTALGNGSWAAGRNSLAMGGGTVWAGSFGSLPEPILYTDSLAMGWRSEVYGSRSVAIGPGAFVGGWSLSTDPNAPLIIDDSVALGSNSIADRGNTISVGHAGGERQIVNVAAGTRDTDAVNLSQLRQMSGGFIDFATEANARMAALGLRVSGIETRMDDDASAGAGADRGVAVGRTGAATVAPGTQSVAVGASASVSADNGVSVGDGASVSAAQGTAIGQGASATAEGSVALGQGAVAERANTVSVGNAQSARQITRVAAGTEATDAANVDQVRSGVAEAKSYTDRRLADWSTQMDQYRDDMDRRFQTVDRRLDRQGAMTSAMVSMATNAAGVQSERGRIAVGAGFQSGERALSVGYAKKIGERASFSLGGAFSGDEKTAGVGFGVDL
ncbi:hypothetical protein FHT08_003588 [Xanthomonas campestris]|uniref:YadA-like family protein n=1 Tax=Xanthomonas sp. CFBP 8151 TaxID=3035310 RepID=UPI00141AD43B|nr:YadA-like family protein [Xanthomonas sp. CFBP 8151]MEB1610518.1 YadA-like family protein [Xanthomonas campestris pv. campestris]NIJ78454.1 hypothetical protein [Xanthomonas sp. CFBP 8151]